MVVMLATKKKKTTIGLETIESQLTLFDSLPVNSQINLIMTELADVSNVLTNFKLTQENYLMQDVDKIHEELMKDIQDPYFNFKFIDERNASWIEKIKKLTANQSILFAVGAGHLGGEKGVLKLLEKEGFTISPIQL